MIGQGAGPGWRGWRELSPTIGWRQHEVLYRPGLLGQLSGADGRLWAVGLLAGARSVVWEYCKKLRCARPSFLLPKVRACLQFLEAGGRESVITCPKALPAALAGRTGTRIVG
jgi:hypothetical protein